MIINIPQEYKRLFDTDWREAAIYGGRFCFIGDTVISIKDSSFKRIDDVVVGDKVLTAEGVYDTIVSVDKFKGNFSPKPMLELIINGIKTSTTYDHKYYNGKEYVPIYQLVWGIMDEHQRRSLKLLCKQYGENTNNEIQRWIQNESNETSPEQKRIFDDSSGRENTVSSQNDTAVIYSERTEKRNGKSQKWNKDRQQNRKSRMGNTQRTISPSMENRVKKGEYLYRGELPKDYRSSSERIITVPLRPFNNANKNDGRIFIEKNWNELKWDKGYAEWKNLEVYTNGISAQKTNSLGSKDFLIQVARVYKSVDVWSISTEKYHNYFANGVNVSNSLKSHTVARLLLIRARQKKTRVGCFREFQNSISDSSHQLLADLIKEYELTDFIVTNTAIINSINGSDFIFKGLYRNEQGIKSVEGIDIAWVEEAQTVSKESLEILTPTIRKDGSQIIYTYNRLLEDDPVHQRLVLEGRPNTLIINQNYDIALKYGMMPEVIRLEMEDDKEKRPALFKHKWMGEPYSLESRIYKDWDIIDEIPHEARLTRRGLDFGYTNDPTVIEDIYEYNGGFIVDENTYQKGLSNKSIADILNIDGNGKILTIADSAEPKSIDEIKLYGVNIVGAIKGKGSVNQGIQFVQGQRISVTRRSQKTITGYRNYIWMTDNKGVIVNTPDDTIHEWSNPMDAIRYGFSSYRPATNNNLTGNAGLQRHIMR